MRLERRDPPHIRFHQTARVLMGDALLTLVILYVMAYYYYGPRVILLALVSVLCAWGADVVTTLLAGRRPSPRDFAPVVTGMILPLLMPATVPLPIVAVAALFGVIAAKFPFGGTGNNVFNPAAAGFAFVTICFPDSLFLYPVPNPSGHLPLVIDNSVQVLTRAPSFTLKLGGIPSYDLVDMALGNFPGPMGATNILVLLACLLYLVFRGTVRWTTPAFFFLTTCALAWLFPRADVTGFESVLYEMMSGTLLLGGVFLMNDPVTTPMRNISRIGHAVTAGIVVMLFRRYSNLEEVVVFAVLLMNATVWGFDMLGERFARFLRGKRIELFNHPKLQKKT